MEILQLPSVLLLVVTFRSLLATNCYQEMNFYHEKYGYGHNIRCTNLNDSNINELKSFIVYNKVRLKISKSNLTNFNSYLFQNLPNIREMVINDSNIDFTPDGGVFDNLLQLELLTLTYNNIKDLANNTLNNLHKLRAFNISNNNLHELKNGSLKSAENLQELDLSGNNIDDLNKMPLCEVKQLSRLYITNNNLKTLTNSSIMCLTLLNHLILDYNNISELTPLAPLKYLTKVSLSHNNIKNITKVCTGLGNLEDLNFEGNKIKILTPHSFQDLPSLQKLNLRNNSLNTIPERVFAKLKSLEELNLEQNNFTTFPGTNIKSLLVLALSYNHFDFEHQEFQFENLRELKMRFCKIHDLKEQKFRHLKSLQILDLSHNSIGLLNSSFFGLTNLRKLNLSGNSLLMISSNSFEFLDNLESLDLSHNDLKDVDQSTFRNLKLLQTLDLSYNYLESLSETILVSLENLKYLSVQNNRLKFIDYRVITSILKNLVLINIQENNLSCQFLTEMLNYFGENNISFSVNEQLSYNKENVRGIPCEETKEFESAKIQGRKSDNLSLSNVLLIVGLTILGLFMCVLLVSYRVYVIIKKQGGFSDEVELLDIQLHKRDNYL